jgi:hypothetical protein
VDLEIVKIVHDLLDMVELGASSVEGRGSKQDTTEEFLSASGKLWPEPELVSSKDEGGGSTGVETAAPRENMARKEANTMGWFMGQRKQLATTLPVCVCVCVCLPDIHYSFCMTMCSASHRSAYTTMRLKFSTLQSCV